MAFRGQCFKYQVKEFCLNLIGSGVAFLKGFSTKFYIKYVLHLREPEKFMTPTLHLQSIRTLVGSTEIMAQLSHWEQRCGTRPTEFRPQQTHLLARLGKSLNCSVPLQFPPLEDGNNKTRLMRLLGELTEIIHVKHLA